MQKKTIKMSLVHTVLLLSMFFSIAIVTFVQAKKPAYTSDPVYINDGIIGCLKFINKLFLDFLFRKIS